MLSNGSDDKLIDPFQVYDKSTFRLTDGSSAKLKIHRRCICQKKLERLSTGVLESHTNFVNGHSHFRFNRLKRQAADGSMVELSPVELIKRLSSDVNHQTRKQSELALELAHQMLNATVDESRELGDTCMAYREEFADGLPCVFPFNYMGMNITSCTKADDAQGGNSISFFPV